MYFWNAILMALAYKTGLLVYRRRIHYQPRHKHGTHFRRTPFLQRYGLVSTPDNAAAKAAYRAKGRLQRPVVVSTTDGVSLAF